MKKYIAKIEMMPECFRDYKENQNVRGLIALSAKTECPIYIDVKIIGDCLDKLKAELFDICEAIEVVNGGYNCNTNKFSHKATYYRGGDFRNYWSIVLIEYKEFEPISDDQLEAIDGWRAPRRGDCC